MRHALGPGTTLGYCTNVHQMSDLDSLKAALNTHALEIKQQISPDYALPVGLWIPPGALPDLADESDLEHFSQWLSDRGLEAFTLNGFPAMDFHGSVVKQLVYRPHWAEHARAAYTTALLRILRHLPGSRDRSISTLPIGWPADGVDLALAAIRLRHIAAMADWALDENEILIHVDLEPEPGCILSRAADAVAFFDRMRHETSGSVLKSPDVLRHIGICHDICHAAVMFEDQATVLKSYHDAGIRVGKLQISSGLRVRFDSLSPTERVESLAQLQALAEDRWLHQTVIRLDDGSVTFHDDLKLAIQANADHPRGEWRIHFHVPVHLNRLGILETTQDEIAPALQLARRLGVTSFEVETYAWSSMPASAQPRSLADGIAEELRWVESILR